MVIWGMEAGESGNMEGRSVRGRVGACNAFTCWNQCEGDASAL